MASYRDLAGALEALSRAVRNRNVDADSTLLSQCEALIGEARRGNVAETKWTPFVEAGLGTLPAAAAAMMARKFNTDAATIQRTVANETKGARIWVNSRYQVAARAIDDASTYLSIKRLDQQPVRSWRDLQRIKNELVGPECEGIELFPAESRLVDTANQYHLVVLTDPAMRIPLGFNDGRRVGDGTGTGPAGQAAFDD